MTLQQFFSLKILDFYKSEIFSLHEKCESVINPNGKYITNKTIFLFYLSLLDYLKN